MLMLKGCAALSAFHTKSQSILSFFSGYCLWQYATGSAYVLVSLRAYGSVFCDSLAHLLCQHRRSYVGNVLLYAPLYSG